MMKCYLVVFSLLFSITSLSAQSTNDEKAVYETLWNYINGRNNGVPEKLKKAFHPLADLRHVKNNELRLWASKDYISGVKPGNTHNCIARIVYVDISGNAAQAKIEIEYPNWKFADYLNLLKTKDEWKIAVKSFSGGPISKKRVLFVLTSNDKKGDTGKWTGFHLGEVTHVYKPLHDAGYEIDFVSPKGGMTKMYGSSMNDSLNVWFMRNNLAYYKLKHAMKPSEIDPERYSAIYYVGGSGTMWDLPNNTEISLIAQKIYEKNGIVSAICHGPSGIVNIKLSDGSYLIKGKRLTSFTNKEETAAKQHEIVPFLLESKLRERGGIFSGADNWQNHVVVDGRLITGQNPASASSLAKAIIKQLKQMN